MSLVDTLEEFDSALDSDYSGSEDSRYIRTKRVRKIKSQVVVVQNTVEEVEHVRLFKRRKRSSFSSSNLSLDKQLIKSLRKGVKDSGVSLAELYNIWCRSRENFLRSRGNGYLSLATGAADGYLCGICYTSFSSITSLQQHCEELLHYACITCGKFFCSYTALGQHCRALAHRKD